MSEEKLSRFVNLASNIETDSDLDLLNLGQNLGLDLLPYQNLRDSQEDHFIDHIRNKALDLMNNATENKISETNLFYSGSIDFMISKTHDGKKSYFLLETNGGSHRGLSILTNKQQKMLYKGYLDAIEKIVENNQRKDGKLLILVGVPFDDSLIHEKILLFDFLRKKLVEKGLSIEVFHLKNFDKNYSSDIAFLIADYSQLSLELYFKNYWFKIRDSEVSLLIGDGIARRFKNQDFLNLIQQNFRKIKTVIINPIFIVTDDKSLTYLAKHKVNAILDKYNAANFLFTKAFNEEELLRKLKIAISQYDKPFIIKPYAGSGGAGVMSIFPDLIRKNPKMVNNIVQTSKADFFNKFMKNRDPFPYTIQQMADFTLINWKNAKHTFDIRIYLSQINGEIIPIGGLARIARGDYIKGFNKDEFVVNLSGFDGRVEVERGLGLSERSLEILNLDFEDFVNIFCNSCIIFKSIVKNYQDIIDFYDWNKMIGAELNEY